MPPSWLPKAPARSKASNRRPTMSANTALAEKYRNNFLKEIEEQVEMGDWVKMCMQCGVCSGSCPPNFPVGLGAPAAGTLHDDPCRQARGSADHNHKKKQHLLLQLQRALPAQAAGRPH